MLKYFLYRSGNIMKIRLLNILLMYIYSKIITYMLSHLSDFIQFCFDYLENIHNQNLIPYIQIKFRPFQSIFKSLMITNY